MRNKYQRKERKSNHKLVVLQFESRAISSIVQTWSQT